MRNILPIVVLLSGSIVYSIPDHKTDSLRSELKKELHDTMRIRAHIALAHHISWNSSDSMISHAAQALFLSRKLNYIHGIYHSLHLLARARFITGEFVKGLTEEQEALQIARKIKNENWVNYSLNNVGLLYLQMGKSSEAITYFQELLQKSGKSGDLRLMGNTFNNLANCYLHAGDLDRSLSYRKQAITMRQMANEKSGLGDSYNDLGETFLKLNNPDSAMYYLEMSLKIKEDIGDDEMCALASMNLGIAYSMKKDFGKAKELLAKSMQWTEKINSNLYRIGILKALSDIARAEGEHKEEAVILRKLILFKDSVYNEENSRHVNQLMAEFETERRELQITALKTEKEAESKRAFLIQLFAGLGILLLSIFLFVVTNRFRVTRRQKKEIEQQKALVDEKQKEILDSIHYAKRIQNSLLPTEKYIESKIKNTGHP